MDTFSFTLQILAGGVVLSIAAFLLEKQFLKNNPQMTKKQSGILIAPLLQLGVLGMLYLLNSEMLKVALHLDSFHNWGTYTPFLGDLGTMIDFANEIGWLPNIERSQEMQEIFNQMNLAYFSINLGFYLMLLITIFQLYCIIHFAQCTRKRILIFHALNWCVFIGISVFCIFIYAEIPDCGVAYIFTGFWNCCNSPL